MSTLFNAADIYAGDPLNPPLDGPTPVEIVAELTAEQREQRVRALIAQAQQIVGYAVRANLDNRTIAATCVLFSGGGDSTVLAHLFRHHATHAIHANTGIGIEQTRQFVRDTCATWGLPLIEEHAPDDYEDLVVEYGFPGPAMHWKMYTRLKERALDQARHTLGFANSRTKVALWLTGRRREESERRVHIPLHEPDGTVIWAAPLANWTSLDLNTYRLMFDDVPVNEVTKLIHMSGECLCGAFAHPGELDEIGYWFPEVRAHIEHIQRKVRDAGHPAEICTWGHGKGQRSRVGRLCSSCDARQGVLEVQP
jgi:3'-phosphoadenosine 5'-phosphosulfate sulfotransferase (PAPS reductase)/FAD synthetase